MIYKIIEIDAITGLQTERDATSNELKQREKDLNFYANFRQQQMDKENAKVAAQSKLAALGLTVEDLQALGL